MNAAAPNPHVNQLIGALPPKDRAQLLQQCDQVALLTSSVMSDPGDPVRHIYFPTSSFVSLTAPVGAHVGHESMMIGNEGAFGHELAFDVATASSRIVVRGKGNAWRLTTRSLRQQFAQSAALRRTLNRYLCVLLVQAGRSAACNRFHLIEAQLARWLLTSSDCAHSLHLRHTHLALARLLGVRRVSISLAAAALQARGLIEYRRGIVTIVDRAGLEAASCDCYRANLRTYADLMA